MTTTSPEPAIKSLRVTLLDKLTRSRNAWDNSVARFRALHWLCLTGLIVVPTCLASLKEHIPALLIAILEVFVAICGSVQAIVKPADKFLRDIEFRDEADYLFRRAEATADPHEITRLMEDFEQVERRFHQGQHPWSIPERKKEEATVE